MENVTPLELVTEALEIIENNALEADRLGRIYKTSISPDVFVKIDWKKLGQADDPVLLEASKWLKNSF
jgi:hypothetical protein